MRRRDTACTYFQSDFHAFDQRLDVSALFEVVGVDERIVERVLGTQSYFAARPRPQQQRHQRPHVAIIYGAEDALVEVFG